MGKLCLVEEPAPHEVQKLAPAELLFSESASRLVVTVAPADRQAFESAMAEQVCALVGEVTAEPLLKIEDQAGTALIACPVAQLKSTWQGGLQW